MCVCVCVDFGIRTRLSGTHHQIAMKNQSTAKQHKSLLHINVELNRVWKTDIDMNVKKILSERNGRCVSSAKQYTESV